jgi:hypothetical protein
MVCHRLTLSFPSRDALPAGDANLRFERFPVPTKVLDSKARLITLGCSQRWVSGIRLFRRLDMSGCKTLLFATAAAECLREA